MYWVQNKTNCAQIKQLRSGYRKALDVKKKIGGGRLVAFFHDKCIEIWSGSPATETMSSGIETYEKGASNVKFMKIL